MKTIVCMAVSVFVYLLSVSIGMGQFVCPGVYDGHLQGITTDESKAIYWSYTTDLVKTDAEGELLVKKPVPSHHGDPAYHDGKVFVAVNLGKFNREPGEAKSWVYVYNAETLDLISKHEVPEVVHGAGGIEYHNDRFYIVGGLPPGHNANYVYEYDMDFKFIKKHIIESGYTLMGIQTVCFTQGCWWFGCYGKPQELIKTDESFKVLGKYIFDCALGVTQWSGDKMLIGRGYGNQKYGGQVLPVKPDQVKGLSILQKAAKP